MFPPMFPAPTTAILFLRAIFSSERGGALPAALGCYSIRDWGTVEKLEFGSQAFTNKLMTCIGGLHVTTDRLRELRRLDERGPLHLPVEVVGHRLGGNGAFHAPDDEVRGLDPPQVPQHHLAGEDERAGVDLVLAGVLGSGPVGRLEDRRAVAHVATGGDAETAHLRRCRVGEVVAVEVGRGEDLVLVRPEEELL